MTTNYALYLAHPTKASLNGSDTAAASNWSDVTGVDYFKLPFDNMSEPIKKELKKTMIPGDQTIVIDSQKNTRTYPIQNYFLGNLTNSDNYYAVKFKAALEYAKSEWSNLGESILFVYDDSFTELGSTFTATNTNGFAVWRKTTGYRRPEVIIGDIQFKNEDNNNITLQKLILQIVSTAVGF